MLGMPARGILEIGRQECELGFSFAEEMASRGAAGSTLEDLRTWFKQAAKVRSTLDRAGDALEATV